MKKVLDKLSSGLIKFSSVVLIIVAIVMVVNILLRAILKQPIAGTMEIVQYGMLICIVLALSRTGFEGRHIRVTVFLDRFPVKVRAGFQLLEMLVSAVVFGWLAIYYIGFIPEALVSGLVTDIYRLPYYFVYIIVALGMIFAAAMFLYHAIVSLKPFFKKNSGNTEAA